jgi:hypothetical protein
MLADILLRPVACRNVYISCRSIEIRVRIVMRCHNCRRYAPHVSGRRSHAGSGRDGQPHHHAPRETHQGNHRAVQLNVGLTVGADPRQQAQQPRQQLHAAALSGLMFATLGLHPKTLSGLHVSTVALCNAAQHAWMIGGSPSVTHLSWGRVPNAAHIPAAAAAAAHIPAAAAAAAAINACHQLEQLMMIFILFCHIFNIRQTSVNVRVEFAGCLWLRRDV